MSDWWVVARIPGDQGERCYGVDIGDPAPDDRDALVERFRRYVDLPDEWWTLPGYALTVAPGEPHGDLLADLTIITVEDIMPKGDQHG